MKNNNKIKVFVGPTNIAGNAMYISKALRSVGIYAKSFSYNKHPFGFECDNDNILLINPFKDKDRNLIQKIIINKYTLRIIWVILLWGVILVNSIKLALLDFGESMVE